MLFTLYTTPLSAIISSIDLLFFVWHLRLGQELSLYLALPYQNNCNILEITSISPIWPGFPTLSHQQPGSLLMSLLWPRLWLYDQAKELCASELGTLRKRRNKSFIDWFIDIQLLLLGPVLKVWSTVKIRGTRVPQNSIVPVGRPRPYSIIILNMRFIPEASLRASSQITATSYILERHELIIQSPLPWPLLGRWVANKLTVLLRGCWNWLTLSLCWHPVNTKHLYKFN